MFKVYATLKMLGKNTSSCWMRGNTELKGNCIWGCWEQKVSGNFNIPSWQNVNA